MKRGIAGLLVLVCGVYDDYKMAAERLGEKVENILFLDDNLNAGLTAKKAGMKVCGVYDDSSKEYVEEIKAATDYYVYRMDELLSLF